METIKDEAYLPLAALHGVLGVGSAGGGVIKKEVSSKSRSTLEFVLEWQSGKRSVTLSRIKLS